jgi:hypothetical protein
MDRSIFLVRIEAPTFEAISAMSTTEWLRPMSLWAADDALTGITVKSFSGFHL